jgi:dTDP-D-glucose 4,6-dehydratase
MVRHLVLTYPDVYKIIAFDKLDRCASLNNLGALQGKDNFSFIQGDITSSTDVMSCFVAHNVDTVLHFAAQSCVDVSFEHPDAFVKDNVFGTQVLLECAKRHKIKRFIHISTDEVYGAASPDGPAKEDTSTLCPTNPYAASKAAAEMFVNAYWKSFKLPVIIVRSNNVYGPHQFPESE